MLTWREVWYYVRLMQRWWWLLVLAVTLPVGVAYLRTRNQPDYYVSSASITIGNSFITPSPNPNAIRLSGTLAKFYAEIANREVILRPAAEELQLPLSWRDLRGMVEVNVNADANLLEIKVTDTNPERAAGVAQAVANEIVGFRTNSSSSSAEMLSNERAELDTQIVQTRSQLAGISASIQELENLTANANSAYDVGDIQGQIDELQQNYDDTQDTLIQLMELRDGNVATQLAVFEEASMPSSAMPSRRSLTVITAGFGGLLLAILGILLLNKLDDRWRDGKELRDYLDIDHLGGVPGGQPILLSSPSQAARREHAVSEVYTRILLAAMERDDNTLLISSPKPSKARSALTVDIAEFYARSGNRVLIVDADMLVDSDLSVSYLSNLVTQDDTAKQSVVSYESDSKMRAYVQATPFENVTLLGRQVGPDDGTQVPMLPWAELLNNLKRYADVIIFDGPSVLNGADAALLSPLVNGVVLTLDPARDTRSDVIESKSRVLRKRDAHLLGAVITSGRGQSSEMRGKGRSLRNGNGAQLLTNKSEAIEEQQ